MRKIFGSPGGIIVVVIIIATTQERVFAQQPIIENQTYNNTTTSTHGLFLPPVSIPHGADEVRAGDGTTCRSALASNEGYLDLGTIGNRDPSRDTLAASVYGRVVILLGHKPTRLNCSSLYQLELQRLRYELDLARMGTSSIASTALRADEP